LIPTTVQEHETIPTTFATLLNLVKDFVDSEVTDLPDPTVSGSDWYFLQETYLDDWADSFFDYLEGTPPGSSVARYTTIFDTVLAISGAIPDNDFITDELTIIRDDLISEIEED